MNAVSLEKEISSTTYPGRGIVIGRSADGTKAVIAYFIMGRSANSRNRVFTLKNGELFTEPFDPSKVEDPSLIIYSPIKKIENASSGVLPVMKLLEDSFSYSNQLGQSFSILKI